MDNTEDNNKKRRFLFIDKSFSGKLSFYVILLTAVLFCLAAGVSYMYSHSLIKKEAIRSASAEIKAANLEIENILTGISTAVDNMAMDVQWAVSSGTNSNTVIEEVSRRIVKNNTYIVGCRIAFKPYYFENKKYYSIYSSQDSIDGKADSISTKQVGSDEYQYEFSDWYQIPRLLGKPYWTDPFFDSSAGNMIMCTYTRPLYDPDNNFIGVITADLPITWLVDIVNNIKPYESSYNLMIGKGGAYIVHPKPERILNETVFTATMDMKDTTVHHLGKEMIAGKSGIVTLQNDDTLSFVIFAPVPTTGWSLAIVCPHRDVFSGVIKMSKVLTAILIIGLILLFFIVYFIVKSLSKPLGIFSKSAMTIAEGNFETPLPEIQSHDEMRMLRDSFAYMQKSLTTYISELKETTSAKERIESELTIARQIQMGMIPKIFPPFPERSDVDLFATLCPAKEVGGDLYDFFIDKERLYFCIGDVSGKGVPASLFMAVTRSLFRSVAATLEDPALIVKSMNKAISETNESNMFVTFFMGILELGNGSLHYCNAGHNPPCLITPDGTLSFLPIEPNMPVGLFSDFEYKDQDIHIDECSTLFLYTDGLTEAENAEKDLFNEHRMFEAIKNVPVPDNAGNTDKATNNSDKAVGAVRTDAETLIRIMFNSVEEHVKGAPQSDDLTMLVLKYSGSVSAALQAGNRRLVIKNQVDELTVVTNFIEKIGEDMKLDPSLVMSLNLAMEEAVSNVIFYAYPKGETDHTIEIIFSKKGIRLTFEIRDTGVEFNPLAKPDADITLSAEDRQIGGLGILMVKNIMDSVEYRRENDKNILTMTKQIK